MPSIDYVTFSVNRTSMPEGSVCRVDYSYLLKVGTPEYNADTTFTVQCELCGSHPLFDKELGGRLYDEHSIAASAPMPVKRSFLVPCGVLDERWGEDTIYLRILLSSSRGHEFTAKSPQVRDRF